MREFLDLPGQSGASYRFRLWPEDRPHVPIAGNYVAVSSGETGPEVKVIGVTNDLSQVPASLRKSGRGGALHLYTRLNVSRAAREAEHQDLAAGHPRARLRTAEPGAGPARPDEAQGDGSAP